jgi:hypothetical protein
MYCLFCVVLFIVFVQMCTELLPPGGYPTAVNKYIIYRIAASIFTDEMISLGTSTARSITLIFKKLSSSWWAYSIELTSLNPERRRCIRVS